MINSITTIVTVLKTLLTGERPDDQANNHTPEPTEDRREYADADAEAAAPDTTTEPSLPELPTGIVGPPTDASNAVIEQLEDKQADLGYTCPTLALPDQDRRHDPFKARELAREAAGYWRDRLTSVIGADINSTYVTSFLGGTGAIALLATALPKDATGRPILQTTIASHEMRGQPSPAEARNTVAAYELMQEKEATAGYGFFLISNMTEKYGFRRFLDKVTLLQALLPMFDFTDYEAQYLTAACKRISAGSDVDSLREDLEDAIYECYRDPWFVAGDWNWVDPPEDLPLGGVQSSRAVALVPEDFDETFHDVNPDDAPQLEPTTTDVDDAYVLVVRPVNRSFVDKMYDDTSSWLDDEIDDPDSRVGDEVRRIVELNLRDRSISTAKVKEAWHNLLDDLKSLK